MKKKSYLIWMILLYGWSAFAQRGVSFAKKNSVSFYYIPMYSKTGFTNLGTIITSVGLRRLYETELPKRGIYGYAYGIQYNRAVTDQWNISVGVGYALYGQRSPDFYSINGVSDAVLDNLPDYGGNLYKISYRSYEFPVHFMYRIKSKQKLNYFIRAGGFLNIYYRVHVNRYIISRSNGERMLSSNATYFHATGSLSNSLKKHLAFGMWRLGFSIGAGLEYEPWPFLSLSASPEFRYYSNLKDTSEASTIVEGDIYSIGMALSTHLKF